MSAKSLNYMGGTMVRTRLVLGDGQVFRNPGSAPGKRRAHRDPTPAVAERGGAARGDAERGDQGLAVGNSYRLLDRLTGCVSPRWQV